MFQSTRPRRARPHDTAIVIGVGVSIHAPAKGATGFDFAQLLGQMFQSTRPRRARLALLFRFPFCLRFNPRAREGRDA